MLNCSLLINLSAILDRVLVAGETESPPVLQPRSHYDLSFFWPNVPLISTQMHIEFYHFFDESVNNYAQGHSVAFLHKINLPPGRISLSQSATLTNAGGFAAARSGPFFIAGLCSRGLSVSVIRIWGLSWLTYVLSLLVQPFPPLTHITALTQGEGAAQLFPWNTMTRCPPGQQIPL